MATTDGKQEFLEFREEKLKLANQLHMTRLRDKLEAIQLIAGYTEPGYEDEPFLLGNWNDFNDTTLHANLMAEARHWSEFVEQLNTWGWNLEWSDEWIVCGECSKGMRTSPDSHWWKPHYKFHEDDYLCLDCLKDNHPTVEIEPDPDEI